MAAFFMCGDLCNNAVGKYIEAVVDNEVNILKELTGLCPPPTVKNARAMGVEGLAGGAASAFVSIILEAFASEEAY